MRLQETWAAKLLQPELPEKTTDFSSVHSRATRFELHIKWLCLNQTMCPVCFITDVSLFLCFFPENYVAQTLDPGVKKTKVCHFFSPKIDFLCCIWCELSLVTLWYCQNPIRTRRRSYVYRINSYHSSYGTLGEKAKTLFIQNHLFLKRITK